MVRKYRVSTLGCKVNQYESQQAIDLLESLGFSPAQAGEPADVALINTCAVTNEALRKSRQTIRRQAKHHSTDVIVIGCGASADRDKLAQIPGVTAVLGHDCDTLASLSAHLHRYAEQNTSAAPNNNTPLDAPIGQRATNQNIRLITPDKTNSSSPDDSHTKPHAFSPIISSPLPIVNDHSSGIGRIERFAGHQRAFLKVQDGCDAHCTYCIIPSLRPTLRSKSIGEAVTEARQLVLAGHREIIVTGIFLGAFGRETALRKRFKPGRSPLADLVSSLAKVEGLARLRLSSLEPGDVDDDLLDVIANNQACVPHLHLPLQSGSQDVLRAMNRQYTRDDFLAMIDRVRDTLDQPAISTDIIVGFPGETEEDFQASLEVAKHAQFCKIHAFPFSPRQGTAAARWSQKFVPGDVVRDRMKRLAQVEQASSLAYRQAFVGQVERVLVEPNSKETARAALNNNLNMRRGRADRYFMIYFESDTAMPGDLIDVRIDQITPTRTHGTPIHGPNHSLSLPVLAGAS